MINYKQKAKNYHTAVSEYDVPTIEEMVTESYIQHNPKVPTGRAAFVSLIPQLASFGSKIKNIRMLNDGQYVIMHHQWDNATPFGFDTTAAFHIIRFNEQGFIAEHWNVMTALDAPNTSGRNLIDGETTIDDLDKTLQNKAKIRELGHLLCTQKNTVIGAELPRFFHAELQQHSPNFGDGLTALQTVIGSEEIFLLIINNTQFLAKVTLYSLLVKVLISKVLLPFTICLDLETNALKSIGLSIRKFLQKD